MSKMKYTVWAKLNKLRVPVKLNIKLSLDGPKLQHDINSRNGAFTWAA